MGRISVKLLVSFLQLVSAVLVCLEGERVGVQGFGVNITVTYDPPLDVSLGPNEYRAASGPVVAVCNVFGGAESTVYSYQWSSTCRQCPFQSAGTNHVVDAVIYSSDAGVNTCTVTDESGNNGTASFEIDVVGAGLVNLNSNPSGVLENNSLITSKNVTEQGLRFYFICCSGSVMDDAGVFIGLDGNPVPWEAFDIAHNLPGELCAINQVGHQDPILPSRQGVYTCRIPIENGQMKDVNVGIYPHAFNTPPTIESLNAESESPLTLTCTSTGSPATNVSWTRDKQPVTIDGTTYQLTRTVTNRAESTYENVLTITDDDQELAVDHVYTCRVSNILGSASKDIRIKEPHQSSNNRGKIIVGATIGSIVAVSIAVAILLCIVLKKRCPRERNIRIPVAENGEEAPLIGENHPPDIPCCI